MPGESLEMKYLTPAQREKLPYALKQGIIKSKMRKMKGGMTKPKMKMKMKMMDMKMK